jgi:hypothetical protein
MSKVTLVLLALAALGASLAAAGEPLTEAAYTTEVASWHGDWRPDEMQSGFHHERCVASWQRADAIRGRMATVTPPSSRAEYHAALSSFVEAYLELMDTCVGNPRPTPEWRRQRTLVNQRRRAISKTVTAGRLDLPFKW